jgi:hypothetical protein
MYFLWINELYNLIEKDGEVTWNTYFFWIELQRATKRQIAAWN